MRRSRWTTFCFVSATFFAVFWPKSSEARNFGETCQTDSDCSGPELNLVCLRSRSGPEPASCQCAEKFSRTESGCVPARKDDPSLELVAILSPLFAAGLLTVCFVIVCCFCVSKTTSSHESPADKYDVEFGSTMLEDHPEVARKD